MLFPLLAGIGALCMSNPGKRRRRRAKSRRRRNPGGMKITPHDLRELKDMIEHLDTPARRARYAKGDFPAADRVKDLNKRYRWDLLWAADRAKTSLWTARVYDYANDAHIDTALRALVAPLAQANPRRRRKSRRK